MCSISKNMKFFWQKVLLFPTLAEHWLECVVLGSNGKQSAGVQRLGRESTRWRRCGTFSISSFFNLFQVWFHNFKSKLLNQYFGIEKRFYIGWKRWIGFVKRVSFQTFNLSCRWYILSDCLRFLWTGVLALDVLRCLSSLTRASNTLSIITSDESEFRIFLAEQSALFTSGPKIYLKLHKNWHEWTFLQVFFSTGFLLFSRLSVVPTKCTFRA